MDNTTQHLLKRPIIQIILKGLTTLECPTGQVVASAWILYSGWSRHALWEVLALLKTVNTLLNIIVCHAFIAPVALALLRLAMLRF